VKQSAPSAQRNRGPILEVLRRVLPPAGTVVEVASGTGEHVTFFAQALPSLTFQPSDIDAAARASVDAWRDGIANVMPPLPLDANDARDDAWPFDDASIDAIVNINMIHISPWSATLGLVRHASRVLKSGAPLVMYGPYLQNDVVTAPSNIAFDDSLRARNPAWGVRKLEDVASAAKDVGIVLDEVVNMPANNLCVVFRKR
jgi:SAM-dependent methyltransferase